MTSRQFAGAGCLALLILSAPCAPSASAQAPAEAPPAELPPPAPLGDLPPIPPADGGGTGSGSLPDLPADEPAGTAPAPAPAAPMPDLPAAPPADSAGEGTKEIISTPITSEPLVPSAPESAKVEAPKLPEAAPTAPPRHEHVEEEDAPAPASLPEVKPAPEPIKEPKPVATKPAEEAAPAPVATEASTKEEGKASGLPAAKVGDLDLSAWIEQAPEKAEQARVAFLGWYRSAPIWERACWGGLAFCGVIGLLVAFERWLVLGRGRVSGGRFLSRFQEMTREGKLDRDRAAELAGRRNAPANRVVQAVLARWGRPESDLERGANLAVRAESDKLRRRVGVLRRLAAFAPLLGLLACLLIINNVLTSVTAEHELNFASFAPALPPLIAGVAMSLIFLALYDRNAGKAESLSNMLDRLGAQAVDAVASVAPVGVDAAASIRLGTGAVATTAAASVPAKNAIGLRIEVPEEIVRQANAPAANPPAGVAR